MKHSHPPTLLTIARRTATDERLFSPGDTVMVAVSGGPDSMALLSVMGRLGPTLGLVVLAHGIDHGLRPEAQAELELARRLAEQVGVPFGATRVDVGHGANLMERARRARYAALRAALAERVGAAGRGARLIATAHHADDRAETVLLRLMRGAGPSGLAVLPPRAGDLVRPIIRARRKDVLLHLERHAIPFAQDPSNRDPHYQRSQVRHRVLPMLAELSPRIVEHLCDLAESLHEAESIPAVLDGQRLGRAQRTLLARALRDGNARVRVPIAGGRVARLDLSRGEFVLMKEE